VAIQFNLSTRNARLDAIESANGTSCAMQIRTGAQPATCATANSGTILATINLPANWMAVAFLGSKAKSGTWQDANADGTGTAAHFRIFNSQATKDETTCFMQGSVTATFGGGDMEVGNTSFIAGQLFTVTEFILTDGNA